MWTFIDSQDIWLFIFFPFVFNFSTWIILPVYYFIYFPFSGSVHFQIIFVFWFYLHLPPEFYYEKKNSSIQQNLEGGSDIDLSLLFKYFSNFLRPTQFNAYLLFQACCYLPLLKIYNFRFCSLILSHFTVLYCLNFFFMSYPWQPYHYTLLTCC